MSRMNEREEEQGSGAPVAPLWGAVALQGFGMWQLKRWQGQGNREQESAEVAGPGRRERKQMRESIPWKLGADERGQGQQQELKWRQL